MHSRVYSKWEPLIENSQMRHDPTWNSAEAADRALVIRARNGERTAFGKLVTRHMHRAYYTALGLVGNHDDALDLSQDAFARAFRARATIDPERPFFPWLYQIIRRLCFNHVRDRRSRRQKVTEAQSWLADATMGRRPPNPAVASERAELRERVARAIERLPGREREVLVLREFQEMRYREIAEVLDIPAGTVMSRLYRARRSLARELAPYLATAPEDGSPSSGKGGHNE